MESRFSLSAEDCRNIPAALELALATKLGESRSIVAWSSNGPDHMRLHTVTMMGATLLPIPLTGTDMARMVTMWVNATPPSKIKHDHDVVYAKGFLIEGHPLEEHIDVNIVELEYHK